MPEIIELTKSSAASLDCLSYMIELRRKNILKAESFLMQHRESLSPERMTGFIARSNELMLKMAGEQ